MPVVIDARSDERIELGDLVEALESGSSDLNDDECLASFAPALRRLANNRAFLGDLVIDELKQRFSNA